MTIEIWQIDAVDHSIKSIFLFENAKEGDLIFEIKQPLLCIVSLTPILVLVLGRKRKWLTCLTRRRY